MRPAARRSISVCVLILALAGMTGYHASEDAPLLSQLTPLSSQLPS